VGWKFEDRNGDEPTKVPARIDGKGRASSTDPSTWSTFAEAKAGWKQIGAAGRGFVLVAEDDLCCVDLDHCRDATTGEIAPEAQAIIDSLDSYTELSPSGTGVHVWLKATKPGGRCRTGGIEVYTTARYMTVTGLHLAGTPDSVELRQDELHALYERSFPEPMPPPATPATTRPVSASLSDEQILELASNLNDAFDALWAGSIARYEDDDSAADYALLGILVFYTRDAATLDRLMRRSGLARDKYDEGRPGGTYLSYSIDRILDADAEKDTYQGGPWKNAPPRSSAGAPSQPSQATVLRKLAVDAGAVFWRDRQSGLAYATIHARGHLEHWALESEEFDAWLDDLYFDAKGSAAGSSGLTDAKHTLAALARRGGKHDTHLRVAFHEGRIYLDLGDEDWTVIEVDSKGWRPVQSPPVYFRRTGGMDPLPMPVEGGSVDELLDLLNLDTDRDRKLITAFLVMCLHARGPYPVAAIQGESGAAKSTTARICKLLIDPGSPELFGDPAEDQREIAIHADSTHLLGFDNVSSMPAKTSDMFCRISTGSGFSVRKHYSGREMERFDAARPVMFTTIEEIITRGDLAQRTLYINLPAIEEEDRLPEDEFWPVFHEMRPRVLGALLTAVSCALRRLPDVKLVRYPRQADLVKWLTAAEPALGWADGTFLAAFAENTDTATALTLEGSIIAPLLIKLAHRAGGFHGSASELLAELNRLDVSGLQYRRGWPQMPHFLSGSVRRIAQSLRQNGVAVEFGQDGGQSGGKKWIRLQEAP